MSWSRNAVASAMTAMATSSAWAQCSEGDFNSRAALPGTRSETCVADVNGRILLFGDYNYSPFNSSVLEYDPTFNTWTNRAPIPTGRGQAACATVNGIVYLFGGNTSFSNWWRTTVEAYDPATNTWDTNHPPIPVSEPQYGRGYLSASTVNGLIYVMGGVNSYTVPTFSDNFIYDPSTRSWRAAGLSLPHPRSHHGAAVIGDNIYLVGGTFRMNHSDPQPPIAQVDVYNTVSGQWTQAAPLPTPRWGLAVTVVDGRIYAIGGQANDAAAGPAVISRVIEEYDPQTDCWRTVTPLPYQIAQMSAIGIDQNVFVIGGHTVGDARLAGTQLGLMRPMQGDIDGDGTVGLSDLARMLANFGRSWPR